MGGSHAVGSGPTVQAGFSPGLSIQVNHVEKGLPEKLREPDAVLSSCPVFRIMRVNVWGVREVSG